MLLKQEPFKTKFQFLFELKWAKRGAKKDDDNSWENKKKEGINQIKRYLQLKEIKEVEKVLPLSSYLIIADGEKVEIIEVKG
jgi:hypothetical protein